MMKILLSAATGLALAVAMPAAASAKSCPTRTSDAADVARAAETFLERIEAGDIAGARAVTSPDFHSFDGGRHWAGPELLDHIDQILKQGRVLRFALSKAEARVDCNFAWVHWINTGSVDGAPVTWQESGVFRRNGKGWQMEVLHSERVNKPVN